MRERPLGHKAYGSIPHLPGSRTGPTDRHLPENLARRLVEEAPAGYEVLVQEKLDGSCVAVARLDDVIFALGRGGDLAERSRNEGRRMFAAWVAREESRWLALLAPGERLVGEWLALAHSTRYELCGEPFVAFDLMVGEERAGIDELTARVRSAGLVPPHLVHRGPALSVVDALERLGSGGHGALDAVEGLVYRLERAGEVALIAKHVRHEKSDGSLLPENTGQPALWNWRPDGDDGTRT